MFPNCLHAQQERCRSAEFARYSLMSFDSSKEDQNSDHMSLLLVRITWRQHRYPRPDASADEIENTSPRELSVYRIRCSMTTLGERVQSMVVVVPNQCGLCCFAFEKFFRQTRGRNHRTRKVRPWAMPRDARSRQEWHSLGDSRGSGQAAQAAIRSSAYISRNPVSHS